MYSYIGNPRKLLSRRKKAISCIIWHPDGTDLGSLVPITRTRTRDVPRDWSRVRSNELEDDAVGPARHSCRWGHPRGTVPALGPGTDRKPFFKWIYV